MLRKNFVQKPLIIALWLLLTSVITNNPAKAAIFTYQGDTTNKPIWRRTAPGDPPNRISGQNAGTVGMSVPYSVFAFTVEQSGLYRFSSTVPGATSPANGAWDNFLVLYKDSFNPIQQLTNVLVANTTPNDGIVAFSRELTAQQKYFLVTTGRQTADFGVFTNTITGSVRIVPVPESDLIPPMLVAVAVSSLLYQRKRDIEDSTV
ncbi:MAG TPA: PEP-CTERM sorting domain-containing protein [Trichormus sp. M33_DOE_039]|nr:PEP-CTERM sorting domain-containing protein [Trichormus sp. M33_DOE_039]